MNIVHSARQLKEYRIYRYYRKYSIMMRKERAGVKVQALNGKITGKRKL